MSEARHPNAPEWYRAALDVPRSDETIEVAGAPIHYLAWGERARQGIVFVHGGGAHAHWWTHVAARYAGRYRVAAIDLSGHGDSGSRDRYSLEGWTNEVMAVAKDAGMSEKPVVVGHSMGGFVTIATSALHPDALAGVIVCDSPISAPDPEIDAHRMGAAFGKPRAYASRSEAIERFRTVPAQEHYLDYVMADVGYHSLRETPEGWRWKFDHRAFTAFDENPRVAARPYLPPGASCCGVRTRDRECRGLYVRLDGARESGHRNSACRAPFDARPTPFPDLGDQLAARGLGSLGAQAATSLGV